MRHRRHRVWSFTTTALAAGVLSAGLTGCVTAAVVGAGAVTYAYVDGDAEGYLRRTPAEVEEAALVVLEDAGVRYVDKSVTEQGRVELNGETDRGMNIQVVIKPKDDVTFASVRVGLVGNNTASGALFKKMRRELGLE